MGRGERIREEETWAWEGEVLVGTGAGVVPRGSWGSFSPSKNLHQLYSLLVHIFSVFRASLQGKSGSLRRVPGKLTNISKPQVPYF